MPACRPILRCCTDDEQQPFLRVDFSDFNTSFHETATYRESLEDWIDLLAQRLRLVQEHSKDGDSVKDKLYSSMKNDMKVLLVKAYSWLRDIKQFTTEARSGFDDTERKMERGRDRYLCKLWDDEHQQKRNRETQEESQTKRRKFVQSRELVIVKSKRPRNYMDKVRRAHASQRRVPSWWHPRRDGMPILPSSGDMTLELSSADNYGSYESE